MTTIAQAAQLFPLVLGGNVFGWTADETESFAVLDAFADAGGVMIDTADMYSVWKPGNVGGESETILGNWMKARGNRDSIVIATKLGMLPGYTALTAENIATSVDNSLRRLQTDYIDLYYAHKDDPDTDQLETMTAFDALVKAGKLRALAVTGAKRQPQLPDVPTVAESGVRALADFESSLTYGILAPKGTPAEVNDRLAAALQKALADPAVASRMAELGTAPSSAADATPAALKAKLEAEIPRWKAVIDAAGVYAD